MFKHLVLITKITIISSSNNLYFIQKIISKLTKKQSVPFNCNINGMSGIFFILILIVTDILDIRY